MDFKDDALHGEPVSSIFVSSFREKNFKPVAVEGCERKAVQAQELVAIDGMKGVGELRLVERVREGLFVL